MNPPPKEDCGPRPREVQDDQGQFDSVHDERPNHTRIHCSPTPYGVKLRRVRTPGNPVSVRR